MQINFKFESVSIYLYKGGWIELPKIQLSTK